MRPYIRYTKGKRRDRRVKNHGVMLEIAGTIFPVVDWSLGGIAIANYEAPAAVGEKVEARLRRSGEEPTYPVELLVMRKDKTKQVLAATYRNLSGDAFSFLERAQLNRPL